MQCLTAPSHAEYCQTVPAVLLEQEIDFHRMTNGPAGGNASGGGLRDVRVDLEDAVNNIFRGSPAQRRAVVERLYAKARALHLPCASLGYKASEDMLAPAPAAGLLQLHGDGVLGHWLLPGLRMCRRLWLVMVAGEAPGTLGALPCQFSKGMG